LVAFLIRSPVVAMVVEGPADNTYSLVRKLVGATKVDDAEPGTIRGDFATVTTENLVHASDGHESAEREIKLWFPEL
jgi:nucleoside-diphosphate kinase